MATLQEVATRWAEQVGTDCPRYWRGSNIYVGNDDRIYSCGSHFELGRQLPDGSFLLNGDLYSVTTSRHQREVEEVVQKTGRPYVLIPYSALEAAGIDKDSIRILDSRAPGYEKIPTWISDALPLSDATSDGGLQYGFNLIETLTWPGHSDVCGKRRLRQWDHATRAMIDVAPEDAPIVLYDKNGKSVYEQNGGWYVNHYRHWLGASLISAKVNGRKTRARFLSSFDENERRPLYFLCELPKTTATSIKEAIEALKPREVVAAEAAGLEVLRQGDVFAIPAPEYEEALWARPKYAEKYVPVLGTSHSASLTFTKHLGTFARGVLRHEPPFGRTSDHARVKMGDGRALYRLVRNTVPLDRDARDVGNARQSGQARAWTLGGRVD